MRKKRLTKTISRMPLHTIVILVALIWILPAMGVLVTSFRFPHDVASTGWWVMFKNPFNSAQYTLENYIAVITQCGIGRAFLNSFIITIPATVLPIIIAAFAAFAFAWMRFPGRQSLFVILVGLLVVPLQMTLIPILRVFNRLGLSGTFPGIWLAHTGYGLPLAMYLLHNSVAGLPGDLFDSAEIDGASSFYIFFRLVLPLCLPVIASLAIFQFLWIWNDLLVALVYLGGAPSVAPITVQVSSLVGSYGQAWELLTAAVFISIIPPLILFFSLQRYFVRGILAGSIKG